MTLYELSLEYEQTAAALRQRISELELAMKETDDEQRRVQLDRRLRPLRSMYRDTRAVARYLSGYYRKFIPGGGQGPSARGSRGGVNHENRFL